MADQPNQYPPASPSEFPQAPPAQPKYEVRQPYDATTPQYAPLPPQYAPTQAVPVRRGRGGSGAMVWLLGGCGLIAVLLIVLGAVAIKNLADTDIVKNQSGVPAARQNLIEIRFALDQYTQEHNGKFPTSLKGVVDPSYLSYQSGSTGETIKASYTPPAPDATDDTVIAGFYVGQFSMNVGQAITQRTYVRLLKDRTIVQEQVTRTPLSSQ